jgi:hypothetical protein
MDALTWHPRWNRTRRDAIPLARWSHWSYVFKKQSTQLENAGMSFFPVCSLLMLTLNMMQVIQANDPISYWFYANKGYCNLTNVKSAHRRYGNGVPPTPQQIYDNNTMSRVRVGVEWGLGKIRARCKYTDSKSILNLY